jgi:hypothetical protein
MTVDFYRMHLLLAIPKWPRPWQAACLFQGRARSPLKSQVEVAAGHATTPEKLNALNGGSFSPQSPLALDS